MLGAIVWRIQTIFRYVNDKIANNVSCALKPYKILMAVTSELLWDFDNEFTVEFVMEENEELDVDKFEQITEIWDLDSEFSEEKESKIDDENEDNMDCMEKKFPKTTHLIALSKLLLSWAQHNVRYRVLDKTTSPISKIKCRVLPLINRI